MCSSDLKRELIQADEERMLGDTYAAIQMLEKLYKGGEDTRFQWKSFFIMHCIALAPPEVEGKSAFECVQASLNPFLGQYKNYLFKTRGSVYTYLIPYAVLKPYQQNPIQLAKCILEQMLPMDLAILIDTVLFERREQTFREDYANHLYRMLTDVFYTNKKLIKYNPDKYGDKPTQQLEEDGLEALKQSLFEVNTEAIPKKVEEVLQVLGKYGCSMECVQEVNYRIYYLVQDMLMGQKIIDDRAPFKPYEWRDAPWFMNYPAWCKMQMEQIQEVLVYLKEARAMGNTGIGEAVVAYIQCHYKEGITLKSVADKFYVNAAYLGRTFQKVTGVTFKCYINTLRIEEAKKRLVCTDELVYEIAEAIGYAESKYFITKFTKEVGMSPAEYRKTKSGS